MALTLAGMVMVLLLSCIWNEFDPIIATVSGMTVYWQPLTNLLVPVWMMALQLLRESNAVLAGSTTMLARFLQPAKGLASMLVTVAGR